MKIARNSSPVNREICCSSAITSHFLKSEYVTRLVCGHQDLGQGLGLGPFRGADHLGGGALRQGIFPGSNPRHAQFPGDSLGESPDESASSLFP